MKEGFQKYFIPGLILLILFSCEDVIEIALEDAEPVLVVDAWLTNESKEQKIDLQMSQAYFDNSTPVAIPDARISLVRDDGTEFSFTYVPEGYYSWTPRPDIALGKVGEKFELVIEWSGQTFSASSEMRRVPAIDSIGQEFRENEIFGDDGIYAQFYARDFPGTGDAYWIKAFKNGEYLNKSQELNLAFDAGFDAGTGIDGLIFIPPIRELINPLDEDLLVIPYVPGDSVSVEIHSLSTEAFNFMEIARDQINNGDNGIFALPLANTRSNVVNLETTGTSALGFFNMAAVSSRSVVIE